MFHPLHRIINRKQCKNLSRSTSANYEQLLNSSYITVNQQELDRKNEDKFNACTMAVVVKRLRLQ